MQKTDILNQIFQNYSRVLGKPFITELKEQAMSFEQKHQLDTDPVFIESLYKEIPALNHVQRLYFKSLHEYSNSLLEKMNRKLGTISTIMVVTFIVAIVALIISLMDAVASYPITP